MADERMTAERLAALEFNDWTSNKKHELIREIRALIAERDGWKLIAEREGDERRDVWLPLREAAENVAGTCAQVPRVNDRLVDAIAKAREVKGND